MYLLILLTYITLLALSACTLIIFIKLFSFPLKINLFAKNLATRTAFFVNEKKFS